MGESGQWGNVPPKFKSEYTNSFVTVFVRLTFLVFEKFLWEVCIYAPRILDV